MLIGSFVPEPESFSIELGYPKNMSKKGNLGFLDLQKLKATPNTGDHIKVVKSLPSILAVLEDCATIFLG